MDEIVQFVSEQLRGLDVKNEESLKAAASEVTSEVSSEVAGEMAGEAMAEASAEMSSEMASIISAESAR